MRERAPPVTVRSMFICGFPYLFNRFSHITYIGLAYWFNFKFILDAIKR